MPLTDFNWGACTYPHWGNYYYAFSQGLNFYPRNSSGTIDPSLGSMVAIPFYGWYPYKGTLDNDFVQAVQNETVDRNYIHGLGFGQMFKKYLTMKSFKIVWTVYTGGEHEAIIQFDAHEDIGKVLKARLHWFSLMMTPDPNMADENTRRFWAVMENRISIVNRFIYWKPDDDSNPSGPGQIMGAFSETYMGGFKSTSLTPASDFMTYPANLHYLMPAWYALNPIYKIGGGANIYRAEVNGQLHWGVDAPWGVPINLASPGLLKEIRDIEYFQI